MRRFVSGDVEILSFKLADESDFDAVTEKIRQIKPHPSPIYVKRVPAMDWNGIETSYLLFRFGGVSHENDPYFRGILISDNGVPKGVVVESADKSVRERNDDVFEDLYFSCRKADPERLGHRKHCIANTCFELSEMWTVETENGVVLFGSPKDGMSGIVFDKSNEIGMSLVDEMSEGLILEKGRSDETGEWMFFTTDMPEKEPVAMLFRGHSKNFLVVFIKYGAPRMRWTYEINRFFASFLDRPAK